MATYKTKGIIIKRSNLGEADRILTIYSQKFGKIKAIAKGIRKILSKLGGNLELFCLDDLLIAEGRNLDIVAGAETIKCYLNLRNNLKSTHIAYYLAEIIDKMTEEKEPHPEIFDLLESALENLSIKENKLLIPYFEINFLSESGFKPEVYKCVVCNQKLPQKNNSFSLESGGLVCGQCNRIDSKKISDQAIKIIRLLLNHKIQIIDKIKTKDEYLKEVEKISRLYLKTIVQKDLKSESFI